MPTFQEIIAGLTRYWASKGCTVHQGYDLEVGAGTFNPATFLRCQGPEPYAAVYVEPSRRPKDGRYGDNPNRLQFYHQMQVIIKPSPNNLQELYLESLEAVGLRLAEHDIRFVQDDWENPTIGAWGLGWEVWSDGMEVTQYTYFQAVGGLPVKPVSGELTYGLERVAMYIQGVNSIYDIQYDDRLKYGDIYKRSEWEWSHYNFTEANTAMWLRHFEDFEQEAKRLIAAKLPIPAYDFVMKTSHAFNILDARGVISVTERTGYIGRIRALSKQLAECYIASREAQGFPLLNYHLTPPVETWALPPISADYDPAKKEDFLLEIGSEELPATYIPIGMATLERKLRAFLESEGLTYDSIAVYGASRRLAVLVKGLSLGTRSEAIEKKGPALAAAFDSTGALTKAGAGFFRSLGLPELKKEELAAYQVEVRNDYLFAKKSISGKSTRVLLAEVLPRLILDLDFPKKMRWGALDIEYPRPLRWLVALLGSESIPFELGGIQTAARSYGHRQLKPQAFEIKRPRDYVQMLKEHCVLVDAAERKRSIEEQLKSKIGDGTVLVPERVMPQVLYLTEWPQVAIGSFDPTFLQAPKEVLISEMVEHQKYFPLGSKEGSLLPQFAIVCDNTPSELIVRGNERALAPRLADGLFLYEQDLKTPLTAFSEKLRAIIFQKDLGSMAEKTRRIGRNVEILNSHLKLGSFEKALRAASLCKNDLATALVGEFPELQGIAGHLYALKSGEDAEVARAVDEHWMPKGEKGALPETAAGTLVSLADKIDNFLGCFALEMQPTASSDPYALRRQAIGLIKIVLREELFLPLKVLFGESLDAFLENPELDPKLKAKIGERKQAITDEIIAFLEGRFRTVLVDMGFGKDEIEAALSSGLTDLYDRYLLLMALKQFRTHSHPLFSKTLEVHTRAKKILLGADAEKIPPIEPKLLKAPSEMALFEKIEMTKKSFRASLEERDYAKALLMLSELAAPVAALFDAVKILDDDLAVRKNRLALLTQVREIAETLLDFGKIQELDYLTSKT